MNGARWRLAVVALLMLMSVAVDSAMYIVSALTDAVFIGLAAFVAWPIVKKIW